MLAEPETRVYEHIVVDERGPRLAGTRFKVKQLASEQLAYGWSPDEMQYQHPDLTLGQIYAALAYYADHEEEINREIKEDRAEVAKLRAASMNSPIRKKLRAFLHAR